MPLRHRVGREGRGLAGGRFEEAVRELHHARLLVAFGVGFEVEVELHQVSVVSFRFHGVLTFVQR